MEQWNESGCKLSLNKLMEALYIFTVLGEQGKNIKDLKGNNISEKLKEIEKIELNIVHEDNITNRKVNFVKYQKNFI